jgi:hypothetical protein
MQSPCTHWTLLFPAPWSMPVMMQSVFWSHHLPSQLSWDWLQEHLDYDLVESSNPAFAKAIVRINVFRNHRQVGHLPTVSCQLLY